EPRFALLRSDDALKAGFRSPGHLNNHAFWILLRSEKERYSEAEQALNEALEANPDLVQARYNRAMLAYKKWYEDPKRNGPFKAPGAAEDMNVVLNNVKARPDVLRDAACVFAAASPGPDDPLAARAVECLRLACDAGLDPEQITRDRLFVETRIN